MKRPAPATWILAAFAAAAMAMAYADPWARPDADGGFVSSRSAARRVWPELAEADPSALTIELHPEVGAAVRIVPGEGGRSIVYEGEVELGPVDPEALDGLVSSLRMATTVRAVAGDADLSLGAGRIVVDDGSLHAEVELGPATSDGSGVYGRRLDATGDFAGVWVLEHELATLVQQRAATWLAQRLVVAEPAGVDGVAWSDQRIERTVDGAWRSSLASPTGATSARLALEAVERRLERLLATRLSPLSAPDADAPVAESIEVRLRDGSAVRITAHGVCPGAPERVLVDRGPGWWGCIDAALLRPWPVPGRGTAEDGALLDRHLLPAAYARVLRIVQRRPHTRTLARYGGGWRIEQDSADGTTVIDVDEPEVFAWYRDGHAAEVELAASPGGAPAYELELHTDAGVVLALACDGAAPMHCRLDDGPWVIVATRAPDLAFSRETFESRRLATLDVDDVRAIEIMPGPGDPGVRQSIHFDLGLWRSDAPAQPVGDDFLDEEHLQGLLLAVAGARAQAWVTLAEDAVPQRRLRIETTPRRDRADVIDIEVHADCVVRIGTGPAARVAEGPCRRLAADLVRRDLPRLLLDTGTSATWQASGAPAVRLRSIDGTWTREDEAPLGTAAEVLAGLGARRVTALVAGPPPGPTRGRLEIRSTRGEPVTLEIHDDGVTLAGLEGWLRTTVDEADEEAEASDDTEAPALDE